MGLIELILVVLLLVWLLDVVGARVATPARPGGYLLGQLVWAVLAIFFVVLILRLLGLL